MDIDEGLTRDDLPIGWPWCKLSRVTGMSLALFSTIYELIETGNRERQF